MTEQQTTARDTNLAELEREGLAAAYARTPVGSLDEIVAVFIAITMGRFFSMRMAVTKTARGYRCVHSIWGIPVATSFATIQKSPVGDGLTYFMEFPNPVTAWLWCDEMRLLPDGGLIGRITAMPTLWKRPLKYFVYRREG